MSSGLQPADVIDGRYRIERELREHVYAATHVALGTPVSIRQLPSAADPQHRERFLQDARGATQLVHPNVVRVTDFGIDRDRPYLVMEPLDGETLRERLVRENTLDGQATCEVVEAIARGLTAIHAAALVHRDLRPEQVVVTARGEIKVVDVGIGHVASPYASPEQAAGSPVDASADLWALGVIAYECLVGARPVEPAVLGAMHGKLPAGFERWFATACHRDRDLRFGSAAEQAQGFARLLARPRGERGGDADAKTTPPEGTPSRIAREDSERATLPLAALQDAEATPRIEDRATTARDFATTPRSRPVETRAPTLARDVVSPRRVPMLAIAIVLAIVATIAGVWFATR